MPRQHRVKIENITSTAAPSASPLPASITNVHADYMLVMQWTLEQVIISILANIHHPGTAIGIQGIQCCHRFLGNHLELPFLVKCSLSHLWHQSRR